MKQKEYSRMLFVVLISIAELLAIAHCKFPPLKLFRPPLNALGRMFRYLVCLCCVLDSYACSGQLAFLRVMYNWAHHACWHIHHRDTQHQIDPTPTKFIPLILTTLVAHTCIIYACITVSPDKYHAVPIHMWVIHISSEWFCHYLTFQCGNLSTPQYPWFSQEHLGFLVSTTSSFDHHSCLQLAKTASPFSLVQADLHECSRPPCGDNLRNAHTQILVLLYPHHQRRILLKLTLAQMSQIKATYAHLLGELVGKYVTHTPASAFFYWDQDHNPGLRIESIELLREFINGTIVGKGRFELFTLLAQVFIAFQVRRVCCSTTRNLISTTLIARLYTRFIITTRNRGPPKSTFITQNRIPTLSQQ